MVWNQKPKAKREAKYKMGKQKKNVRREFARKRWAEKEAEIEQAKRNGRTGEFFAGFCEVPQRHSTSLSLSCSFSILANLQIFCLSLFELPCENSARVFLIFRSFWIYFWFFYFWSFILFFFFIFIFCLYRARYRNLKTFADCHLRIWVRFEIWIGFLFLLSTFSPTTVLETRVRVGVQQSDRTLWGIARSRSCEARALPGRRGIPWSLNQKKTISTF